MSAQTYTYEAHFKWKWHKAFDAWAIQNKDTVENNLQHDFSSTFLAQFAEKMAAAGHWYKMDSVTTNFTSYNGAWGWPAPIIPVFNVDVEGETIITFETDIQDATAHASPQLWQIISDAIQNVIAWLGDHPQVVVFLLAVGVLVILAVWLINTVTGAINQLGASPGSLAITIGILVIAGVVVVGLLFTSKGKKITARVGRRAKAALPGPRKRKRS